MVTTLAEEISGRGLSVHASALDVMADATNYHQWVIDTVSPYIGQRILEVGAGLGTIADTIAPRERLVLMDNDPICVQELEARFPQTSNLAVLLGDILDGSMISQLGNEDFDTILCINVLEHIARDIDALANMHRILVPGGRIVIFVPAFQSLYGTLDRNLGHERRYNRHRLAQTVMTAGFTVSDCRYFNSLGIAGWYFAGRIRRQQTIRPEQVRFYDHRIVPFLARIERHMPLPFGQSLLVVGSKSR
jgi:SAM-dependent methyltransferase